MIIMIRLKIKLPIKIMIIIIIQYRQCRAVIVINTPAAALTEASLLVGRGNGTSALVPPRVQSTQIWSTYIYTFYIRDRNYGLEYILHIWVHVALWYIHRPQRYDVVTP